MATTADTLRASFDRRARHHPIRKRWAADDPVLDLPTDQLIARLRRRREPEGRASLAALVRLVRGGDADAALLATIALLPAMFPRLCDDMRNEAVSVLYETITKTPNPEIASLWESIQRTTYRRLWAHSRQRTRLLYGTEFPESSARDTPSSCGSLKWIELTASIDQMCRDGEITATTRMVLERIAADEPVSDRPRSTEATKKFRQRHTRRLRDSEAFRELLIA